jgi:hypothetical protein
VKQLRRKFGRVPREAQERLRQITDPDALDELAVRLLDDVSLSDLGLTTDGQRERSKSTRQRKK